MKTKQKLILTGIATKTLLSMQIMSSAVVFAAEETPIVAATETENPVASVDSTSVDPTSVDPTPVDPTLVGPTPVDPTPVDPTPVDPTPVDPAPVDPTPVDPTPVDPTPVDPTPIPNKHVLPTESKIQEGNIGQPTINQQNQETQQTTEVVQNEDTNLPKTGASENNVNLILLLIGSVITSVLALFNKIVKKGEM